MDLRQLAALVAVSDHRTFSAAARALHTVQSNVSTHVARLERELGVSLVERSSGRLTEAGETVVQRAKRVQAEIEAMVSDVASVSSEVTGVARLGAIGTTARWLVPPVLNRMAQEYPGIRVLVNDGGTSLLLPLVHSGRLDLAVVAMPVSDPDLVADPLFEEDLMLVAPIGHPLAERESVDLADLAEHPLILQCPGTLFRDNLDLAATAAGVTLQPKAEVDGMRLVATLAFEGYGAAVLPTSARPRWLTGGFRVVRIEGTSGRTVGLARRRRGLLSAPARALRDIIREVIATEVDGQRGIRSCAE
jgi:LysR family hydrogen peroxide-inducible transcriptional activator